MTNNRAATLNPAHSAGNTKGTTATAEAVPPCFQEPINNKKVDRPFKPFQK
jgi:hypothetical protein